MGQLLKNGPVEIFLKLKKNYAGIGWASVFVSWMISIYYAIILCWCFAYLFISFQSPLPWTVSDNENIIKDAEGNNLMNKVYC